MIEPEYRELLAMRRQHEVLFKELKRRGFGGCSQSLTTTRIYI